MTRYMEKAKARAAGLGGECIILAIETSCDETAAAVMKGSAVLSGSVYSQVAIHRVYGGVVPEIASRNHVIALDEVISDALKKAGKAVSDIDAVAVTYGPGLVGALLCGVSYAKALAFSRGLPLVGINHIEGHICANYIENEGLKPPFACLVASGGHSHIVMVEEDGYELIGRSLDDAAGEALDKAARILGLEYPGGPELEKLAANGDPSAFALPKPRAGGYDMTFSGLKTAFLQASQKAGDKLNKADAAAAYQRRVVSQLTENAVRAAIDRGVKSLALAGGVAANGCLRESLTKECERAGLSFFMPSKRLCTDNAEMIGAAGYRQLMRGNVADLSLNAEPSLKLV